MKELYEAIENNELYDYVSNNYYLMEKHELAEIIKELSFAMYQHGIKDNVILEELKEKLGEE